MIPACAWKPCERKMQAKEKWASISKQLRKVQPYEEKNLIAFYG